MENNSNSSFDGKNKKETSYYQTDDETGSKWWNESMNRRKAGKTLAIVGGAVVVGAIAIAAIVDDEDDDVEVQQDSKSLQQKEGWNVGATDKQLVYPEHYVVSSDSRTSSDWFRFYEVSALNAAYEPKKSVLKAYYVPTLPQSLGMGKYINDLKLFFTPEMARAYSQGLGMKEALAQNKNNDNLLLIVDMPGEESVAFAAAMSDCADLILTFDNIPHPLGVVPSHLTLGALVYYAGEVEEKRKNRVDNAVSLFVLDRKRFVQTISEDTQFDNRYLAKLPSIDDLKSSGVTNIMYLVNNEKQELDDLNDDFVAFQNAGISINMVELDQFKAKESDSFAVSPMQYGAPQDSINAIRNQYHTAPPVYHYGGGIHFIPVFYSYHPYMSYGGSMRTMPATSMRPSTYRPAPRQTIFSAQSFGGAKGVGRTRPSGFGMVTTRVSSSSGRLSGVRAGRSGSFGRSSSFGG